MKKLAILVAVIGLALNVAVAENVKPLVKTKAKIEHNGYNLVKVSVEKVKKESIRVNIYDNDFALLHTESFKSADNKLFEISQLNKGHYIVKIMADGETIHTEAIEKIK